MSSAQKEILNFRFHARGGQGAKTAAQIFAEVAFLEGNYIQAFPEFGPERRGAPVTTYVRVSKEPLTLHCAIQNPEFVIVLDSTLACDETAAEGVTEDSLVLVNSTKDPEEIRKSICVTKKVRIKINTIDASAIALHFLGKSIPNTVMLGALIKASGVGNLEELKEVINRDFGKKWGREMVEKNFLAAKRGHEEMSND